jgi:carbon monoxide dehydrogenase subunit G
VELNNDFEVRAPIEKAWAVLTDVERIAPCLPGAQLQEVEGDEYRGIVKVKVGPITAQYKGAATFVEQDDANHRAVLKADGRDTRGAGNASALITAKAEAIGDDRTKVTVSTDLTVTGKVAQFGRGVMADVSAKLMGQFADNLEKLLEEDSAPAADASAAAATHDAATAPTDAPSVTPEPVKDVGMKTATAEPAAVRKIDSPEPQAVNLLDTAGAPVFKRLAPLVAAVGIVFFLLRNRRKKK